MAARVVHDGQPTPPWATGYARFEPLYKHEAYQLTVAVRCRIGNIPGELFALLDTGAQWSIIGGEVAEALQGDEPETGAHPSFPSGRRKRRQAIADEINISTRLGEFRGRLHRVQVTLVADSGMDLLVESSVVLVPSWSGPLILGYGGFLEHFRIAMDPGCDARVSRLFFGSDG